MLARRKGTRAHRTLGRVWIALMVLVAFSALFIHNVRTWGLFSPLHMLIPWTLGSCWYAVWTIRQRQFVAHAANMIGLYGGALIIAGGLTFLPGRLMHRIFLNGSTLDLSRFDGWPVPPWLLPFALGAVVFVLVGFLPLRRWLATLRPSGR